MNSVDRPEFVEILNGLAAIKRVDLTKEAYEIWWRSMKDWSLDEFGDAAGYLVKNCQFMPSPYDFEQLREQSETSTCEAWSQALEHAKGAWREGGLGEPCIDRVVAMLGGYRAIALTDTDKLGFLEHRFMAAYDDFSLSSGVRGALPKLTDRVRIRNSSSVPTKKIKKALARSDQASNYDEETQEIDKRQGS